MKIVWKAPILGHLQHMFRLSGCSLRKCCVVSSLLLVLLTMLLLLHWDIVCTNYELSAVLLSLCSLYKDGVAMGDLCPAFCRSKTLQPDSCQAWHGGKEVVFSATYRGNPVFVKGRKLDFTSDKSEEIHWVDDATGQVHYPSFQEFLEMVQNYLKHNHNIVWGEDTLYKLWPHSLKQEKFTEEQNQRLFRTSIRNIWALVLDNEYIFSRLFEHYDVFPELYGTCGGFYVVEKLQRLDFPTFMETTSFDVFVKRVKISLKILDLLDEFETMFDHPVHLCDVKPDHFGLSEHGRIKYVDVDTVYFQQTIDNAMGDQYNCSSHQDCDFFDCRGQCDLVRGVCVPGVVNNNLQVVCEKVLVGKNLGFKMLGSTGLLWSEHADSKLKRILQKCANPSGSNEGIRIKAEESVKKELIESLKEIVEMSMKLKGGIPSQ